MNSTRPSRGHDSSESQRQDTSHSGNDRTWLTRNSSPLFDPNRMRKYYSGTQKSVVSTCGTTVDHVPRLGAQDRRDERDAPNEVGTQSIHVAPFSHISSVTLHGRRRNFSASVNHTSTSHRILD